MQIRPARDEDTPVLKELTAGTGVFKPHEIEVLQEVLDDYHAREADSPHQAIVAEQGGEVVGYAYYAPDVMTDRTWYLYWIAVAKPCQGRGIGEALLRYVEQDILRQDGRILLIETSSLPHSARTRQFYLKQGYTVTGVIRDFYSDGDDMVVFRKRLQGMERPIQAEEASGNSP